MIVQADLGIFAYVWMLLWADVTLFLYTISVRHKNACAILFYDHGAVMFAVSQKSSITDLVIEDWWKKYI